MNLADELMGLATRDVVPTAMCAALALDFALGDPRGLPHPVQLIGRLIAALDRRLPRRRWAGVALVAIVLSTTGGIAWGATVLGRELGARWGGNPTGAWWGAWSATVLLGYWGLAARSLADHAWAVATPLALAPPDLANARAMVSRICGRETAELDPAEVARATVESVAENTVDGVVAPLFWLAVGGPIAMWVYKATSTLDSMVGYRDERYRELGWASARLDDLLALAPARLAVPIIGVAAILVGGRPGRALRVGWRDGHRHASPNAGRPEAAFAGALAVRLGGPSRHRGAVRERPVLGAEHRPCAPPDIARATRLMLGVAIVSTGLFAFARLGALAWAGA